MTGVHSPVSDSVPCPSPDRGTRPGRRHRCGAAALVAALAAASPAPCPAAGGTLELAVLPHLNARALMALYRPLREYLERGLDRPVLLVTAPDYHTLVERTRAGRYEYLITAPHFARLAQTRSGYVPLVRAVRGLSAVIVTPRAGGADRIESLRGAVVATPDRLAIVSMLGIRLLRERGLVPGVDVTVRSYPSFASALLAVLNGEAAAAVSADPALRQMAPDVRERLRTIDRGVEVTPIVLLARGDVPAQERAAVKALLLGFHEDPAGRSFFARTGLQGYREPTREDLEALDPFVVELTEALERH